MNKWKNRIAGYGTEDPEQLLANPLNFRIHPKTQQNALSGSLETLGWIDDVVINKTTGHVVDGHARIELAISSGEKEIPVKYVELSAEEERQALLSLDPISAMATVHQDNMEELLKSIKSENESVNQFLEILAKENNIEFFEQKPDLPAHLDMADELQEKWQVRFGDLWEIGKHRLLCGDCTKIDNINDLFRGDKCNAMITDPPYGVNYAGKNDFLNNYDKGNCVQGDIENDAIENYRQFFADFIKIAPFAEYNVFYIFMSGKELHNLRLAIEDCKCVWGDYLIWVKNNHVLGRKDYNSKHEFIVYGWRGRHKFYGGFQTTILNFDRPMQSKTHPTTKPVKLLSKIIQDGTLQNFIIYDPFLGSGSTIVAAEQTNRICYGLEIEPKYCSVVLERMTEMGIEPQKISNKY
jgi:DNA modification methylase